MPATTLAEIVQRAETGWPLGTVPYSQSDVWNDDDGRSDEDGYRRDCSGFASMALGIAPPGLSTVTLVPTGTLYPIPWSQMQAGDFVMLGGPGTAGNAGHVGVVTRVNHEEGWYEMLEQFGGLGPARNRYRIGQSSRPGMIPYRSKYVTGASMDPDAFPWPTGHVAGHVSVQNARGEYHGGQDPADQPYIQRIQQRLIELGYDVGPDGADGVFGDNTKAAVEAWARATGRPVDGTIGADDWAVLFAPPPIPSPAPGPEQGTPPATVDLQAVLEAVRQIHEAVRRVESKLDALAATPTTGPTLPEGDLRTTIRTGVAEVLTVYARGGATGLAALTTDPDRG